uniref:ZnMc domain-containing protein n=1 Tax=Globodera pallida TaxID=36090 RepID=A0A183BQY3_GLOPA
MSINFLLTFHLILLILFVHSSLCSANANRLKSKSRIAKRFVLHRHQWDHCQLTWSFRDPFLLLPSEERFKQAKKVIGEAISKWEIAGKHLLHLIDVSPKSRESPLNSHRVANIDIFFAEFVHGDGESFDGSGGLVAHSAYPPLGIVHFDASERWNIGHRKGGNAGGGGHRQPPRRGGPSPLSLDLRYVALHEIGHALGLRHSAYRHSVMNTYYRENLKVSEGTNGGPATEGFNLSKDDEAAINELFGDKCHQRSR